MKKTKLALNRETLRQLSVTGLERVHGGSIVEPTGYTYCIACGSGGGGGDTVVYDTVGATMCAECME
jgi:hypothetical protein